MYLSPDHAILQYPGCFRLLVERCGEGLWFWTETYYEPEDDVNSDRGFDTFLECVKNYQETQYGEPDIGHGIDYDDEYSLL
jgi:hypothetical protein